MNSFCTFKWFSVHISEIIIHPMFSLCYSLMSVKWMVSGGWFLLLSLDKTVLEAVNVLLAGNEYFSWRVLLCLCVGCFICGVCFAKTCSWRVLLLMPREGCASWLWHSLGSFTYSFHHEAKCRRKVSLGIGYYPKRHLAVRHSLYLSFDMTTGQMDKCRQLEF